MQRTVTVAGRPPRDVVLNPRGTMRPASRRRAVAGAVLTPVVVALTTFALVLAGSGRPIEPVEDCDAATTIGNTVGAVNQVWPPGTTCLYRAGRVRTTRFLPIGAWGWAISVVFAVLALAVLSPFVALVRLIRAR
jgi:hypothetical protein